MLYNDGIYLRYRGVLKVFVPATQAFSARRADIAESLLQKERQQTAELQAEVSELQLLLEEQVWLLHNAPQCAQPWGCNPLDVFSHTVSM